ncbi:MAG TPA: heavy metal translocating P-type ATPase [Coleofasciculaceae cyanobacterium]
MEFSQVYVMFTIALPTSKNLRLLMRQNPDLLAALACAVLLSLGWFSLHLEWIGLGVWLLIAAYGIGGYESAREGILTLWQEREFDVDLLMIVAALGAAGLGFWRQEYSLLVDGAVLILIFSVSGALEHLAMQRTDRNIRNLMSLAPDSARRIVQGQEQQVPISQLQIGDRLVVRPGEYIPTDSKIIQGSSTLNEASITGESIPAEKSIGDEVFAGTLNGQGALTLQVHKSPESSLIQRVIRLVEQAQTEAPPSQQFIERFERSYARLIIVAGCLLATLPPFLWGWTWETTIYRALIFLVVASPCALMAAIMPTLLSGIAQGARQGILFKGGSQLEMMGQVKAIAFDKTGTLTTGQLRVHRIIAAPDQTEQTVLATAAALEVYSEHPMGQAIVKAWQEAQGSSAMHPVSQVQAQTGRGIVGMLDQQVVVVGKAAFVQQQVAELPTDWMQWSDRLESEGQTVIWVARNQKILGLIAVADTVRSSAAALIQRLKRLGVEQIVMLTGDNERAAQRIAQEIGIDQVYADLLPEDKVQVIQQLQHRYHYVAMVGDGINDAPALAQASVGIAMGGAGSDVALETADVVLMADRLEKLEQALGLGRRSQGIVKQNIVFALGVIGLLLISNFVGGINMPTGVIGHEGSTLLVTLNGLRLLRQ